jgi:hypothetical protein
MASMAADLEKYRERSNIVSLYKQLFPNQVHRSLRKALAAPPAEIHARLFEDLMKRVSKRFFPMDMYDIDQVLDIYPAIPIDLINYDEESEMEEEPLVSQIAAAITGHYHYAPSWEHIQTELGSTIPLPPCFTVADHECRVALDLLKERCEREPMPISGFPTILQIFNHDTGTIFLDASSAYVSAYDLGYFWQVDHINELAAQWQTTQRYLQIWKKTEDGLTKQPALWRTIFQHWQTVCEEGHRNNE